MKLSPGLKKIFPLKNKVYSVSLFLLSMALVLAFVVLLFSGGYNATTQPKRYIYIIGGAHHGERVRAFMGERLFQQHPWEIFAIEANPYLIEKIPKSPHVKVINKAIWIKDGTVEFYFYPDADGVSGLYKDIRQKKEIPMVIESMNFGMWLERSFSKNDLVVVSFDIEGSEYEVLKQMVNDNTIRYIDKLFIEVHPGRAGKSVVEHKKLFKKIYTMGIYVQIRQM